MHAEFASQGAYSDSPPQQFLERAGGTTLAALLSPRDLEEACELVAGAAVGQEEVADHTIRPIIDEHLHN